MKRFTCIAIILSMVLLFAACGAGNPRQSVPAVEPDAQLAAQCLQGMIQAETVEDMKTFMTEDSHNRAQEMFDHYTLKEVTVKAEYKCHNNGYDVFSYTIESAGETAEEGVAMFFREEDGYKLCVNATAQEKLVKDLQCKLCSGSGMIVVGNPSTCGICGGTGMQYYPNVYFDATLNTWMGQHMACSGCGGAGTIGAGGSMTCSACQGVGLLFQ